MIDETQRELLGEMKDPTFIGYSGNVYVLGNIGVQITDAHRSTVAFINAWEAVLLADQILAAYPDRREA
jgi:hypothetical protein